MGFFKDKEDVYAQALGDIANVRTGAEILSEGENYAAERDTFGDFLASMYQGSAGIIELTGRGIQQTTGLDTGLTGVGERMMQGGGYALPDESQYRGDTSFIDDTLGVVANTLPSMAAIGTAIGTGAAAGSLAGPVGTAAGGVVGGLGALFGIFGAGTYNKALEEISIEKPELSAEDRHQFAFNEAAAEVGWELAGSIPGLGFGAKAAKGFAKAGLKNMLASGAVDANQIIAAAVGSKGQGSLAKALLAGGLVDGASEVATELSQVANARAYGMDREMMSLPALFVGSMLPGSSLAGLGYAGTKKRIAETTKQLNEGLTSEDPKVRSQYADVITNRLTSVDPEYGPQIGTRLKAEVLKGPVSLETLLGDTQEAKIVENPEPILEAAGIPTTKTSPYGKGIEPPTEAVRPDLAYLQEKNKVGEPQQYTGLPQSALDQYEEYDPSVPRKVLPEVSDKITDYMMADVKDISPAETKAQREAFMQDIQYAFQDMKRARAIEQGMAQVDEWSNSLVNEELTLDERAELRRKIEKNKKNIAEEVKDAKGTKGKATAVPVAAKEPSATVATEEAKAVKAPSKPVVKRQEQKVPEVQPTIDLAEEAIQKAKAAQAESKVKQEKRKAIAETELDTDVYTPSAHLNVSQKSLAKQHVANGVTEVDAEALAVQGRKPSDKPLEVKKPSMKTKEAGRFTDGTEVFPESENTDRAYRVVHKGKEYRSRTMGAVRKAVSEGTVDQLEPWAEKAKSTTVDKLARPLTEKENEEVSDYLKANTMKDAKSTQKDLASSVEMTEGLHALAAGIARSKDMKLTPKNVGSVLKQLVKQQQNMQEDQRAAREGLSTESVSFDQLTDAQEKEANDLGVATELEAEDTMGIGEDTTEDNLAAADVTVSVQKDKGESQLQKKTYFQVDKEKNIWQVLTGKKRVAAEEAKIPSREVTATPDERFGITTRKDEGNVVRVDLVDSETGQIYENFNNPQEAEAYIKDIRAGERYEQSLQKEKPKTVVRRRKGDSEALDDLDSNWQYTTMEWSDQKYKDVMDQLSGNPINDINEFDKKWPEGPPTQFLRDVRMAMVYALQRNALAMRVVWGDVPNAKALALKVLERGTEAERSLAQMILDSASSKLEEVPVLFEPSRMSSAYNANSNKIYITGAHVVSPKDWLHEVQHSLTVREMKENKELRDLVTEERKLLREAAKEILRDDQLAIVDKSSTSQQFKDNKQEAILWTKEQENIAYALINNEEFLSQSFSEPAVRKLLMEANAPQSILGKLKNAWDALIEGIRKALGFSKDYKSLMEAVVMTSRELYEIPVGSHAQNNYGTHEALSVSRDKTTDQLTADVLAVMPKGKKKLIDSAKAMGRDVDQYLKKTLAPISDRIRFHSEKIYARLMQQESSIQLKNKRLTDKATPFFNWYAKLTPSQKVRVDLGLFNKDKVVWDEMPKDVRLGIQSVLKELADDAIGVALLDEHSGEYYFPRRVDDMNKLTDYVLSGQDEKGPIGVAIKDKAKQLGVTVEDLEHSYKVQVVADMMQSGQIRSLGRPGATKQRTIPKVDGETYGFYQSASDALVSHIYEMTEKIGMRQLAGGSVRKQWVADLKKLAKDIEKMPEGKEKDNALIAWDSQAERLQSLEEDLKEGIAGLVASEMGTADTEAQRIVIDALSARMRQKGAHGVVDNLRNVGYAATMGNFLSAITQLGDIPIVYKRYGFSLETTKSIGTAFSNVYKIMRGQKVDALVEDVDFTNALREFSNAKLSNKALETIFKYSGLKYADLIGKEAAMQSSYKFYQNPKNAQKFIDKYEVFFGDRTKDVLRDIQLGKRTDDVKTMLLTELSQFQPVTLSQQSEYYLLGGNWRALYSLKTFTLRTTTAALREAMDTYKSSGGGTKGVAKGAAQMASILMIYALAGAGTDELKDLLSGRTSNISDNVLHQVGGLFFMNKYAIDRGIQSDSLISSMVNNMLPPVRYMDNFAADVLGIVDEDKEFKMKSLQTIPLVGSLVYRHSDAGKSSFATVQKKDIMEQVKKNAKDRKGAYSGGLSKAIREYNKNVSRDDKINNDTVMRAYRNA